jgi:uncharacterized protein YecT (DUF1311 family)
VELVVVLRPVLAAFLATLALSLAAGSAIADEPQARDLKAVQACLKAHDAASDDQEKCIGVVARPCVRKINDQPPSEVMGCYDREQRAWDMLLNAAYHKLRDNLDDDQRDKLRDMQKSWLDTRDRTCAFYYDYFQGTMANPMIRNCNNRETARRALFLIGFAEDLPKSSR